MKPVPSAIAYSIYVTAVAVIALEGICRLGLLPNPRYRTHAELDKRKGSFNVVVVGDSFSVETPISAATLLRQHLQGRGIATLNLAGGGFSPRVYLSQLRAYAFHYNPRLILVN